MQTQTSQLMLGQNFFDNLIGILSQNISSLKSLLKNEQIEIECRIGRPKNISEQKRKWEFDSSISSEMFNFVKEQLDQLVNPIKTSSEVQIKQFPEGGSLRMIKNVGISSSISYQRKQNIQSLDSLFISQPLQDLKLDRNIYMMRFSVAKETSDSNDLYKEEFEQSTQSIQTRLRERYEYVFDSYVIDLTITDYKNYEIELEFSQNFIKNIDKTKLNNPGYMLGQLFIPPIKKLLGYMFPNVIQFREINNITGNYIDLVRTSLGNAGNNLITVLNRDPRPKNISEKEVSLLYDGYSFTNKLNGIKYRLMVTSVPMGGKVSVPCLLLINNTDVKLISVSNTENDNVYQSLLNTLVDVELFINRDIGEIHAFDCLILQGKNNTIYSHDTRLDNLRKVLNNNKFPLLNGWKFFIKEFFYTPNDPVKDLTDVLKYMKNKYGDKLEQDNDGIIMTPVGTYIFKGEKRIKQYYDREYWIYKWKFPSTVSIDFQIKKIDKINKIDKNNKLDTNHIVYELLVNDYQKKLTRFGPFTTENGKYFNPPFVYISNEKEVQARKLIDGKIVEFTFDKKSNSFIIHVVRIDKVEPNNIKVAQDTFVDMAVEFSLHRLLTLLQSKGKTEENKEDKNVENKITQLQSNMGCLDNYRYYHNRVKEALINKFTKNKYVLDLGSGMGGDLYKFYSSRIKFLWAVEPNKNYIEEKNGLIDRLKSMDSNFSSKVKIINTGAESTKLITQEMIQSNIKYSLNTDQANIVSSFFSLTFFFSNNDIFSSVINTITNSLAFDGYFIGTTIDGQRVYDLLKRYEGKYNDPNNCFTIESKYGNDLLDIGNKIEFDLRNTPTVRNVQTEWLVPFDILVDRLNKNNIKLIETSFFDSTDLDKLLPLKRMESLTDYQKKLSNNEVILNSLYRYFVFKKVKPEISKEIVQARQERIKQIQDNSLKNLPIDKVKRDKYIKLYDKEIYRTGVLGGGSCFYHCVLYNLLQIDYIKLSKTSREELATEIRSLLANNLTPEMMSKLGDQKIELAGYTIYLQQELEKWLITKQDTPLITKEKLDAIINSSMSQISVNSQQQYILNEFNTLGFNNTKDIDSLYNIILNARTRFLNDYKTKMASYSEFTTHDSVEYIMRTLNINIFIITDSNRLPVKFCDCSLYNPDNFSIVILNLQGLSTPPKTSPHYEPLSDFYINNGDTYHTTMYDWNNPLIQTLFKYLCDIDK